MGDHTRNVYIPKLQTNTGLGKFTVVKKSCLGCKNILKNDNDAICQNC